MTPTAHISVANVSLSKFTTSGAINSGVPNIALTSATESKRCDSPKSITLIVGISQFSTNNTFSGCNIEKFLK